MTWPFIGRQEELGRIHQAMSDAAMPGIVVAGAAGVGKTRLGLEALASVDPQRYLISRVIATQATSSIPFGAFAQLLPAELPATGDRVNVLGLAAKALIAPAGDRRLVLSVDDAHLLDGTSAALLYQLIRSGNTFVVALVRSGEPAPEPIVALWKHDLVERLELQALSEPNVKAVLTAALGAQIDGATMQRLWRATGGNTLLLRELVVAGLDTGRLAEVEGVWCWDGPWVMAPRLLELIEERLGRLDADEQAVLEVLAYGEPLGADLLAHLAASSVVEAVEAKGLVWVEQDRRRVQVRLAHPLYGEVLRARCPRLRARRRQRQLADAIEAAGARRWNDWLKVATWRLDAATAVTPQVLVAAARQAWAALDLSLAERLARAAFDAGGELEAAQVLWRIFSGHTRSAEAELLLESLSDAPVTDQERVELAIGRVYNLFGGGDPTKAFQVLRDAQKVVHDQGWRDELSMTEAYILVHAIAAKADAALQIANELLDRPTPGPRANAQARVVKGMALTYLGRPGEAVAFLEQARPLLDLWLGDQPWWGEGVTIFCCHAYLLAGQLVRAAEVASQGYAAALTTNWHFGIMLCCVGQAQAARMQGRVQAALGWLREALGLCRRRIEGSPYYVFFVLGELAHAEALAGNAAAAEAALREADDIRHPGMQHFQFWVELARPWVAVAGGDRQRGIELALGVAALARECSAAGFEAMALHDVVRLGAASKVSGRLHELAAVSASMLVQLYSAHATAAAASEGAGLDVVAASFERLGAKLVAAEVFAQAAAAHRRAGRAASARHSAAQAALLVEQCDGVRTPALEAIQAPQLTNRERDIAKLAAAGLSNSEIADRLVIARRTVDNHLHQVYAKLGIRGRAELGPLLFPGHRTRQDV
jgi:ATP/maltotriose-dependent transcriptional regulator MalT